MSEAKNVKAASEFGKYIALQQLSGATGPNDGTDTKGAFLPTGSVGVIYLASGSTGAGAGDGVHNVPNSYADTAAGTKFHFTSPLSASHISASVLVAGHIYGDLTAASLAADNLTTGDAAVTIRTTTGGITVDADAGNVLVDSNAGTTTIDGHTGVTIQATNSGDITLDSVGDVILDADGADILFKDAGVIFGGITHNGGIGSGTQDLILSASYQNGDIIFSGSDAGTGIIALTLDMSDAGHAKFKSHVSAASDVYALGSISGSNNLAIGGNMHISGAISQVTATSYLTATDEARLKAGATVSGNLDVVGYLISRNEAQLKVGATVSGSFHALGNMALGNANTDVATLTAQLTSSAGINIADSTSIYFGAAAGNNASIRWNDATYANGGQLLAVSSSGLSLQATATTHAGSGGTTHPIFTIENGANNDAAGAISLFATKQYAALTAGSSLGDIAWESYDAGDNFVQFALVDGRAQDVSDGAGDGELAVRTAVANTLHDIAVFHASASYGLLFKNHSTYGTVKAHSFPTYSDEHLKENIVSLTSGLEKVKQLQGVTFDWKASGESDIGFIAQDVEEVIPELVTGGKEEGDLGLNYPKLTVFLTEAIKEQQTQIEELKAELAKKADKEE